MSIQGGFDDVSQAFVYTCGVIPGHRGLSNDPYTYQSDLVEAEVERIMYDADALADVLEHHTERPIAQFLAYMTIYWRTCLGTAPAALADTAINSEAAVQKIVQEHCEKEAGL